MLKKREEVNLNETWDLTTIYQNDEAWELEFETLSKDINEISKYNSNMLESIENVKNTLKLNNSLSNRLSKLYTYAHLKSDENTANSKYQIYSAKMRNLISEYSEKSTFVNLSLLELSKEKVEEYFSSDELKEYAFFVETLLKSKEHTLSKKEEELLASLSQISSTTYNTFTMLNNADISFEDAEDEKGEKHIVSHSRYIENIESKDRVLRKNSYNSVYSTYKKFKNTFASTLQGAVLSNTTYAKIRKYNGARNMALSENFIDESVYDSLISAVNDKISSLHKYMEFRKKQLGLDEMYMYDLATSLIKEVDLKFTFEEAKEIILDTLQVMGEEYVSVVKRAFDERWIDYAENEGKRSGAYSGGAYETNPFILISWNGTIENLFTLIHELGHSIHSYYTRKYQPYVYGRYTIFVAEVASITNELLLNDYLLRKYENNDNIKAYILNHYLDQVKSTLYRQTQFAEFEYEIHKSVENGKPLTADTLSELYYSLVVKYYGNAVSYDENISYEWARIPHFYYEFYVYQYATGMSAASMFAKKILTEGKEAVDKYIEFLKSGCSDYSLNILKKAGVDMSSNKPVYACLEVFDSRLVELEKILNK